MLFTVMILEMLISVLLIASSSVVSRMLFSFLFLVLWLRHTNCLFYLQNGSTAPGSKSRIPQMVANTLGFGQKHDATVDIPLDSMNVI